MQKPEKTRYSDSCGSKDYIQSKLITAAVLHKHLLGDQTVYKGKEPPASNAPATPPPFRRASCHFNLPAHHQPGKAADAPLNYFSILAAYLQSHITGMSLKLFAEVFPG